MYANSDGEGKSVFRQCFENSLTLFVFKKNNDSVVENFYSADALLNIF